MASAKILGFDNVAGPNWIGKHGRSGHYMRDDSYAIYSSLPNYVSSLTIHRGDNLSQPPADYSGWSSSSAARLYLPNGSRTRAIWYHFAGLAMPLTVTDDVPHLLSLYHYDGDSTIRRFRVEVWNITNTTRITQTALTTAFPNGVWTRIAFRGSVIVKIALVTGANSVLSGILFDEHVGQIGLGGTGNYCI